MEFGNADTLERIMVGFIIDNPIPTFPGNDAFALATDGDGTDNADSTYLASVVREISLPLSCSSNLLIVSIRNHFDTS